MTTCASTGVLNTPNSEVSTSITAREREVFAMMAEGASNGAIAQRLDISERTAQGHVSNILAKLDVHSRAEAIAMYYRAQQVAPDPSLLDEQA